MVLWCLPEAAPGAWWGSAATALRPPQAHLPGPTLLVFLPGHFPGPGERTAVQWLLRGDEVIQKEKDVTGKKISTLALELRTHGQGKMQPACPDERGHYPPLAAGQAGPTDLGAGPTDLGAGPTDLGVGPTDLGAGPTDLGAGPSRLFPC